jgi:hypothetical protein
MGGGCVATCRPFGVALTHFSLVTSHIHVLYKTGRGVGGGKGGIGRIAEKTEMLTFCDVMFRI